MTRSPGRTHRLPARTPEVPHLGQQSLEPVTHDELEAFRQTWQTEVAERYSSPSASVVLGDAAESTAPSSLQASTASLRPEAPPPVLRTRERSASPSAAAAAFESLTLEAATSAVFPRVTSQQTASWEMWRKATLYERQGSLGGALASYRKALRLNPAVEVEYRKLVAHPQDPVARRFFEAFDDARPGAVGGDRPRGDDPDEAFLTFYEGEPLDPSDADPGGVRASTFAAPVAPTLGKLQPEIAGRPCPLALVPDELVARVLLFVLATDVAALSKIARVAQRFYAASRAPSLWHSLCEATWPLATAAQLRAECAVAHGGDWRALFVARPRARRDGVYISRINYIRMGQGETTAHAPVHVITYYRYLRFLTDSDCVLLTSTAEPATAVRLLAPFTAWRATPPAERLPLAAFVAAEAGRERIRGLMCGVYALRGTLLVAELQDVERPRTVWRASLQLRASRAGQHNLLQWERYQSYTLSPGARALGVGDAASSSAPPCPSDATDIVARQLKRFVFSRVRSWVAL